MASARQFDANEIMISALAVPFPELDEHPTEEREQRLEAIIKNLETYRKEVRNNIVNLSNAALQGTRDEELDGDNSELLKSLDAKCDRSKGDVYVVTAESLKTQTQGSDTRHDPRVEALLRDYEAHAQERLQHYRDALRREQAKNGTMPVAAAREAEQEQEQEPAQKPLPLKSGIGNDRSRDPRLKR